jgi:hydroxyethylthiazole kinase
MIEKCLAEVKRLQPLVHNITNYVTVNDCANMLLACGAAPIMADDLLEVEEITTLCKGLVINIGTLNARTVEAMIRAGKQANKLDHPVLLDPVGAGASTFRSETVSKLLAAVTFTVIRGNISEIKALAIGSTTTQGVDANTVDQITSETLEDTVALARELSLQTGAIIVITGAMDIVTDSKTTYKIFNGHPHMGQITGSGCMLSAVIGAFISANPDSPLDAVLAAVTTMGLCGEMATRTMDHNQAGLGSFKTYLLDAMSLMTPNLLKAGARYACYSQ